MSRFGWGWPAVNGRTAVFLVPIAGILQRLRKDEASGAFVGHRTLGDYGTKAPAAGDNDGWREGLFVRRWLLASWEAGEAG